VDDEAAIAEAIRQSPSRASHSAKFDYGGGKLEDFDFQCVVGVGSFGEVWRVKRRDTGQVYAMKWMEKVHQEYTEHERWYLEGVEHPFICKLHFAFQTEKHRALIFDLLTGGEVFYHIQLHVQRHGRGFSEPLAGVYAAETALAIAYLHTIGIMHRDLKPENLMLDREGHINLIDLGCACRTTSSCGSHAGYAGSAGYMAPEQLATQSYTKAVDWWALGICWYEMVVGMKPFYDRDNRRMNQLILNKTLTFPDHVSLSLRKVLRQLLDRNDKQRLSDIEKLKQADFFKEVDFDALYRREIPPGIKLLC